VGSVVAERPADAGAAVTLGWHPSADPAAGPWFEVLGSMVYPAADHPDGPSPAPWFQLRGSLAYRLGEEGTGRSDRPWYWVDGPTVRRSWGHPDGPSSTPAFFVQRAGGGAASALEPLGPA